MRTEPTIRGLRAELDARRARGERIALVPTMGYLHEGHLSLIDRARQNADTVVMSIFVNPLQFGPKEDLATYPRDLTHDSQLAEQRGVDLLFTPSERDMYPDERPLIRVVAPELGNHLCGRYRPGHFEGVLTVVAKLFNIVRPDVALFGQKDYQQFVLIRRMARDLDMNVEVMSTPITREPDGLALSSRNVYLASDERRAAASLYRALQAAAAVYANGERSVAALLAAALETLDSEPAVRVQYLEIVDPERLEPVDVALAGHVVAIAAFVGKTRLIDNLILE
jgi:pantoate--beta-alanine ligase